MTEQESGKVPEQTGADREQVVRPGLTWRALAVSVAVAVVLSATVALLLGGFRGTPWSAATGGLGARHSCCPPPGGSGPVR